MVESNGINRLVYDFFEARILFGYYSCGDNLPSISKICSMFNMATATVRTALARLEKKGYIRVDARKAPKVTYNALPEKVRENATIYLVRREKGIADIFRTGEYLFGSLWEAGVYRWDQDTLVRLRSALTTPAQGMVPMPIEFYLMAFDGLHNGLISSLYWDVIQYMMFPYLENHDDEELLPEVMKGNSLEEVITVLNRRLLEKNRQSEGRVFAFLEEVRAKYPDMEQIPFGWTIYRQRPQIRYSLVSQIIREILSGTYPAGSYLPSLPQMAQKYGVAMSTVRRTLSMLDALGFVTSYQGKGTQVRIHPDHPNCSGKDVKEGMRLYREGLELLTLTVGPVSRYMLGSIPEEKRNDLIRLFDGLHAAGISYLCFERYLTFIRSECPSALIRECYSHILELLAWGYPFALQKRKDQNLHLEYDRFVSEAVACLKNGETAAFSEKWAELMCREERQFAETYGL